MCTRTSPLARRIGAGLRTFAHDAVPCDTSGASVVVTWPIHPLFGRSLLLTGEQRGRLGLVLVLEHPDGFLIRLPVRWTDRALTPAATGNAACASREGLVDLADLVAGILKNSDGAIDMSTSNGSSPRERPTGGASGRRTSDSERAARGAPTALAALRSRSAPDDSDESTGDSQ